MLRSSEGERKVNYKKVCNCLGSTQFLLATSVKKMCYWICGIEENK